MVVAQVAEPAPASPSFRELLADEGIVEPLKASFQNWQPPLTAEQRDLAARVLFRLDQIDSGDLRAAVEPFPSNAAEAEIGGLFTASGLAVSVTAVGGPADADQARLWRVTIESNNGPLSVLSRNVPRAWRDRDDDDKPLIGRVSLVGVLVGSTSEGAEREPLLLANRLAWFPASGVNAGVAWLAQQGLDAALLDAVQHGRAFAKNDDGREARAFYETLATVAQGDAEELLQLARNAIAQEARAWKFVGDMEEDPRTRVMAAQVERRAEQGVSSVWPLFLDPQGRVGQPVLIEGTARRAVKVLVTDGPPGLASYYELDVFTADSQNQPVICCVARLPVGFPTGDAIREPVRVAGLFLKKWAYSRRADPPGDDADSPLPKRLAPPLVIAAEPVWLHPAPPPAGSREIWIGAAIAAVIAGVWFTLARVARRDRLARSRRARYDESLDALE